MSRIENTGRNMSWQVIGVIVSSVFTFVNRLIFMKFLGEGYLGVSGLFSAVLGVLSFADLGISGTLTYCFYKPIAEKDKEHIAILLRVFRNFTRIIVGIIFVSGMVILPFIRQIVTGGEFIDDRHLKLYFFLFLIETISSYLYSYRLCYVTALQEAYTMVPFTIVGNVATAFARIVLIVTTRNYTAYLVVGIVMLYLQKFILNVYIMKKHPETDEFSKKPLPAEDKKAIKRNMKGAIYNAIALISGLQTDSILISAYINIGTVGLVANYSSIQGIVSSAVALMQTSVVASMGDLIAKESKEKQLDVFYTYMSLNSFVLGFVFCGIALLSGPFITLIFGANKCIDGYSLILMCLASYVASLTRALIILPTAGGYLNLGAHIGIIEGGVNLAVSIVALKYLGLPGVFLGTLVAALSMHILRPIYIFKGMYGLGPSKYYARTAYGFVTMISIYFVLSKISKLVFMPEVTIARFVLMGIILVLVYTGAYVFIWQKDKNFKSFYTISFNYIKNKINSRKNH